MSGCDRVLARLARGPATPGNECVLFEGYIGADGYGRVNRGPRGGSPKLAHRYAYELLVGSIPEGHELHHRCGVRACVNPEHLQVVTRAEHRSLEREAKTHCHRGHPYSIYARNHQGRAAIYCTECQRMTTRRRRLLSGPLSEAPSPGPGSGASLSEPVESLPGFPACSGEGRSIGGPVGDPPSVAAVAPAGFQSEPGTPPPTLTTVRHRACVRCHALLSGSVCHSCGMSHDGLGSAA